MEMLGGKDMKTDWDTTESRQLYLSVSNSGVQAPHPRPGSLCADVRVFVGRMTHLAEAGYKEIIAAMVGGRVLFDVSELDKLQRHMTALKTHHQALKNL